jgi:hypothetical protein
MGEAASAQIHPLSMRRVQNTGEQRASRRAR